MRFNYVKLSLVENQEAAKLNKYMTLSDLVKVAGLLSLSCLVGLFVPDYVWHWLLLFLVVPSIVIIFYKNTFLKKRQLENYLREQFRISKKTIYFAVEEDK